MLLKEDICEKVSIILQTGNRKRALTECLFSIVKQDYQIFAIMIIDKRSTHGMKEMIIRKYSNVRLIF
jgi:GT2 family glycosyltransferase